MAKILIKRRGIALLLTGAYILFAILAIKGASHASIGKTYSAIPIVTTIAYVFCVYFFIEIQRGNSNIFEKAMAWASAGVFVVRLVPLLHVAFPSIPPYVMVTSCLAAALIIIAAISLILRTTQLFYGSESGK